MKIVNEKVCDFIEPVWLIGKNIAVLSELTVKFIFFLGLKTIVSACILIVMLG